jgi:hypothetical protein
MFKFLRKYNKWILAVGGTLLLIVFLIPQAITTLAQRAATGGAAWATVGDDQEELPAELRAKCAAEVELLLRLGQIDRSLPITDDPEHWYLLVREADEQGLLGANPRDMLPPETLTALYAFADNRASFVDEVLAKRLAIQRMSMLYQNAGKLSDVRMHEAAERLFTGVDVRMIVLEAEPNEDLPAPTEAELQAHFEKYRDVAAGDGSTFGYRLPDRIKIEWLRVGEDTVRAMVEASDELNPVAIYRHWQRHVEDKTKAFPPFAPGAAIPDAVRKDLFDQITAERMEEIQRFVNEDLYDAHRQLPREHAYYALPADWEARRPRLDLLAEHVRTRFAGLALPQYEAIGDRWLTLDDLRAIDAVSNAETSARTNAAKGIVELIASAKEFGGIDPTVVLQEGVVGPILRDRLDGSLVVFRLIGTDPQRAPVSLDEVRDAVTSDLRRKAAYDRLLARRADLERQAIDGGLVALGMELGKPVVRGDRLALQNMGLVQLFIQQNMPLRDSPSPLPVIGENIPALETVVERALALPRDKPVEEQPRAERIFTLPVEDRLALMVVELTRLYPLTREQYRRLTQSGSLQFLMISKELNDERYQAQAAFTRDALIARHKFKLKTRDEEGEAETTSVPENDRAASAD